MLPYRTLCLALASTALLLACGDDDDGDDPIVIDLNGAWTFTVDVTVANGVCAGEENDDPVPFAVDMVVVDPNGDGTYDVSVTGDFGDAGGTISGTVVGVPEVGDQIVLSGNIAEDGGTTTSTYTLTIVSDTRLTGFEEWSWTGVGGTCPDGEATVVVARAN
ncbi:MAG TPA: hypothetical protein VFY20_00705 [Gemmatimonadales bacterium]|nr:hypothetical protein [Gemmatimonadales bacterium]